MQCTAFLRADPPDSILMQTARSGEIDRVIAWKWVLMIMFPNLRVTELDARCGLCAQRISGAAGHPVPGRRIVLDPERHRVTRTG